jgi:hypothetical protein
MQGWQVDRMANGTIIADPSRFPSGIQSLASYMHEKVGVTFAEVLHFCVMRCAAIFMTPFYSLSLSYCRTVFINAGSSVRSIHEVL